jgi:LAO/AO transport system kinase
MPLPSKSAESVAAILAGDWRQAAKLITRIECGDPECPDLLRTLYRSGGRSHIIGVTGAPGAGKSTLVNQLLTAFRRAGKRVAVLAIDPSSLFSGGALLGDRIRMQRHSTDENIFIRSMSSRGTIGGLATAAGDAITVLDAMGWDAVIVETVGVGQNEIDIVRYATTVVLIETPSSGDAVQSVKAGVAEIGDIFVVNKSDQEGADRRAQVIADMLQTRRSEWLPLVLKTDSLSGRGTGELLSAIESHYQFLESHPAARKERLLQSIKLQILWIIHERTARRLLREPRAIITEQELDDLMARRTDPYELALRLSDANAL